MIPKFEMPRSLIVEMTFYMLKIEFFWRINYGSFMGETICSVYSQMHLANMLEDKTERDGNRCMWTHAFMENILHCHV